MTDAYTRAISRIVASIKTKQLRKEATLEVENAGKRLKEILVESEGRLFLMGSRIVSDYQPNDLPSGATALAEILELVVFDVAEQLVQSLREEAYDNDDV